MPGSMAVDLVADLGRVAVLVDEVALDRRVIDGGVEALHEVMTMMVAVMAMMTTM